MLKAPRILVMASISAERDRQEKLREAGKFRFTCQTPKGLTNPEKMTVLTEEVGEVARAVLEDSTLVNDVKDGCLYDELIQVAAVAAAWAESVMEDNPNLHTKTEEGD